MDDPGAGFGTQKAASYPVGIVVPFPDDKSNQVVKVITDLHLVARLRRRGTVPPLPYVFSVMPYRREKKKSLKRDKVCFSICTSEFSGE